MDPIEITREALEVYRKKWNEAREEVSRLRAKNKRLAKQVAKLKELKAFTDDEEGRLP